MQFFELQIKNLRKIIFNKNCFYNSLFFLIFLIYFPYIYLSFSQIFSDYVYSDLLINYSGGFIRRGLLGELNFIFSEFTGNFSYTFFAFVFSLMYFFQIFLFYILLKKYKNFQFLLTIIVFSPALLLFNIYDLTAFMRKDIFFNVAILIHAYYVSNLISSKYSLQYYNKLLLFVIIPFLFINSFIHEIQIFFICFHVLLSYVAYSSKNLKFFKYKLANVYFILLVPFLLSLIWNGDVTQINEIKKSYSEFSIPSYIAIDSLEGNFNYMIGGFLKHFILYTYVNFINLFLAFLLSIVMFFVIFHSFMITNFIKAKSDIRKNYIYFFLPCILIVIPGWDFGRWINIILIHMMSFYFVFKIDDNKYFLHYKNNENMVFIIQSLLLVFVTMYILLWSMPVVCCYKETTIFHPGLFHEIVNLLIRIYYFIDRYIVDLLDIAPKFYKYLQIKP